MKRITMIGTGLGAESITAEAHRAIAQVEVLIGSPRLLALWETGEKPAYPLQRPQEIADAVAHCDAREFAVLLSGDVGFYSAAAGLLELLSGYELRLLPGISSVGAFFARLKLPWQDAAFVSAHGRQANIVDTLRRNRLCFCLTGGNVNEIGADLCRAGFREIKTYVGENLGTAQERVYETSAERIADGDFPPLTVLLFVNEAFDASVPCGLPDECFVRGAGIPMSKSETRALLLSKLRLRPEWLCWDVGAGTGSVTVEMALSAYRGQVYALERRAEAVALIEQNCRAFHLGNVTALCGEAPAALHALPAPDAVFIGGSGGKLAEIIDSVLQKIRMQESS